MAMAKLEVIVPDFIDNLTCYFTRSVMASAKGLKE